MLYSWLLPLGIPIAIAAYIVPNQIVSSVLIFLMWVIMMRIGPLLAPGLLFTPTHLRARVSAGISPAYGVLGIGLTPVPIGLMSGHVFGPARVGWSIASVIAFCAVPGIAMM